MSDADDDYPDDDDEPDDDLDHCPGCGAHLEEEHAWDWCPLDQPCHADVLLELANA